MSSEEIIRSWKDSDYNDRSYDHPAGAIRLGLTSDDDEAVGASTPVITATIAASALIGCAQSILHGSCGAFGLGCVPTKGGAS